MSKKETYLIGLEREAIRLNKNGEVDSSLHPEVFGDKLFNQYITTDFSESQLELVTPPFEDNKKALDSLKEILSFIKYVKKDICLHNLSMPPSNASASIASFGVEGKGKEDYRKYLLNKYGLEMQLISGIHYNFSGNTLNENNYLHIIRNTIRFGYILPYLFGNSRDKKHKLATSLRLSSAGYFPKEQQTLNINFNSKEGYLKSISECNTLYSPAEYYLFIRPKFKDGKITYIELRSLDINPNTEVGITIEMMEFAKSFLLKMKQLPSPPMEYEELLSCLAYHDKICLEGKKEVYKAPIEKTLTKIGLKKPSGGINEKIIPKPSEILQKAVTISLLKSLECSTRLLIEDAYSQNISVEIIDKNTNTIKLKKDGLAHILSKATFTEKDTHISYLLQKDKNLTKKLLKKVSISTPESICVTSGSIDYTPYLNKKICIKPVDSNYGNGISILKTDNPDELKAAVEIALKFSNSVLIENFFDGEEYRFFVIDSSEVFVCKRSPPKVTGDGSSSIKELIDAANTKRDPNFLIKYDGDSSQILEKNKTYLLRENSNVSTGGISEDFTDRVHPEYNEIAKKAAAAVKGFLCGIDIIIKDAKLSPTKDNYTVLETNYNPALYLHQHPLFGGRKVSRSIFKALGFTLLN